MRGQSNYDRLQVLVDVTQKATSAEKVKAQVQVVKDRAQALVDEINLEKGVAEGKLLAAEPALKAAEAALLVSTEVWGAPEGTP